MINLLEDTHPELSNFIKSVGKKEKPHGIVVIKNGKFYKSDGSIKECTIGRNDLCPCGSGKKYKKCCLQKL